MLNFHAIRRSRAAGYAAVFAACLALTGCSRDYIVNGLVQNSKETFSGTATGYADRSGTLTVTTTTGATCTGDFVIAENRKGEGVFNCSDGRSGPFEFVTTYLHGTGHGSLGNENLTFTFSAK